MLRSDAGESGRRLAAGGGQGRRCFGLSRVCWVANRGMICADTIREVADNLRVKEVWVKGRRYVVCHNPQEAVKDAADREAMVKALADHLRQRAKGLAGNRGFRRFVKVDTAAVSLDQAKVKAEARFDGKYGLRTNAQLAAAEVAVQ